MPAAHVRHVTVALWLAVAALLVPLAITLSEMPSGGTRVWLRLVPLLVVESALMLLLARQRAFERRLRERLRVEDELRTSEAKFSGILSIAADAIISVDESQRIIHFNRGAEEIFGYSADEALGQRLDMLIPARFRAAHDGHMRAFAESRVAARRMGERREIFGIRRGVVEFSAEASM